MKCNKNQIVLLFPAIDNLFKKNQISIKIKIAFIKILFNTLM